MATGLFSICGLKLMEASISENCCLLIFVEHAGASLLLPLPGQNPLMVITAASGASSSATGGFFFCVAGASGVAIFVLACRSAGCWFICDGCDLAGRDERAHPSRSILAKRNVCRDRKLSDRKV